MQRSFYYFTTRCGFSCNKTKQASRRSSEIARQEEPSVLVEDKGAGVEPAAEAAAVAAVAKDRDVINVSSSDQKRAKKLAGKDEANSSSSSFDSSSRNINTDEGETKSLGATSSGGEGDKAGKTECNTPKYIEIIRDVEDVNKMGTRHEQKMMAARRISLLK